MDRRRMLLAGIAASLVLAMWEMVVEAVIPGGAGLLGPPIAIGATIVRDLQGSSNPIPFDATALVVGLVGHMMNGVVLAAVFGVAALRLRLAAAGLVAAGVAFGVLVYAAMWFVVLPVVDPLMLNLNAVAFLVAHLLWGLALGVLWARLPEASSALRNGLNMPEHA